jgi:AcrR family transcriptional regulator
MRVVGEPIKDRRVQKTERRLRDALVSLIHEKSYDAIVVKEILQRADIGRSAFYTHFRDKDALLASGIHEMLQARSPRPLPSSATRFAKVLWFSLPVFEFIGQCRHTAHRKMDRKGRVIVHQHLRHVLIERITDDVKRTVEQPNRSAGGIPTDLLVEYIVATFILVLNWWVESRSPLSPREVDDLFLSMVLPTLTAMADGE